MQKGGLGAPLVPEFHKYLFAESNKRKVIFNIGGISNGTYLDGEDIKVGNPLLDGATVTAEVVDQFRAKKVTAFKFKRRKGFQKKKGHRQHLTRLTIKSISA